jgi:large subunit ribosomal protein L32
MPVPKRKRSRARRDKRFANKGLKVKTIAKCANCQTPIMPHQACRSCGHYKGRKVVATKADRAVKRAQTKAHAAQKESVTQAIDAQTTE